MSKPKLRALLALTGILVTTWIAIGQQSRRVDQNTLKNAGKSNTEDWLMYGLNYQEQRYSLLKQIDATNVGRLGLAWTYEIGQGGGNQEGTPLVYNGILYSITNWSITYAVDVRTGKELWRYDPEGRSRGHAAENLLRHRESRYRHLSGQGLRAGDRWTVGRARHRRPARKSGACRRLPSTGTTPSRWRPASRRAKSSSATPAQNILFAAMSPPMTPKPANRSGGSTPYPAIPQKGFENKAMEAAAKTWGGEWYKFGGGGTVWDGMTYDPDSNLVYFGTGNGGPWPSEFRQSRGLDNLYVCSVVALNADTGEYKWHYQFVPGRLLGLRQRAAAHAGRSSASTDRIAKSSCRRTRMASSTFSIA